MAKLDNFKETLVGDFESENKAFYISAKIAAWGGIAYSVGSAAYLGFSKDEILEEHILYAFALLALASYNEFVKNKAISSYFRYLYAEKKADKFLILSVALVLISATLSIFGGLEIHKTIDTEIVDLDKKFTLDTANISTQIVNLEKKFTLDTANISAQIAEIKNDPKMVKKETVIDHSLPYNGYSILVLSSFAKELILAKEKDKADLKVNLMNQITVLKTTKTKEITDQFTENRKSKLKRYDATTLLAVFFTVLGEIIIVYCTWYCFFYKWNSSRNGLDIEEIKDVEQFTLDNLIPMAKDIRTVVYEEAQIVAKRKNKPFLSKLNPDEPAQQKSIGFQTGSNPPTDLFNEPIHPKECIGILPDGTKCGKPLIGKQKFYCCEEHKRPYYRLNGTVQKP